MQFLTGKSLNPERILRAMNGKRQGAGTASTRQLNCHNCDGIWKAQQHILNECRVTAEFRNKLTVELRNILPRSIADNDL